MKKMKIRDRIVVYLPIAVAGATIGILGVYSIEMNWISKILHSASGQFAVTSKLEFSCLGLQLLLCHKQ